MNPYALIICFLIVGAVLTFLAMMIYDHWIEGKP